MKRLWLITISALLCAAGAVAQDAAPKHAKTLAGSTSKYDTKLPIEISSDSLEVLQHENKAIFKGNVVAVQGQMRLKSDVMIVHYRQKDDQAKAAAPKPAPKPAAPGDQSAATMGAISRIDVEGNVFVASPEESAKGDKGDYDVDSKTIHLFGDNVVLTRDKNILRGTALEYNLETGRSLLTNNGSVVNGGQGGGRVRGVFVPNQDTGKPNSKTTKPAASAPATATPTR